MRVLIVEDDHELADILKRALSEQSYQADMTYDGESALYMAESEDYDLIILRRSRFVP